MARALEDTPRLVGVAVLFAAVTVEVEGEDAFLIRRALKHFWMAQCADGVVIAGTPVLLHAGA